MKKVSLTSDLRLIAVLSKQAGTAKLCFVYGRKTLLPFHPTKL